MMPYDSYRLYQVERPKSAAEMKQADMQAAQFTAAASGLFRSITRTVRVARSYRRDSRGSRAFAGRTAQCATEPAARC